MLRWLEVYGSFLFKKTKVRGARGKRVLLGRGLIVTPKFQMEHGNLQMQFPRKPGEPQSLYNILIQPGYFLHDDVTCPLSYERRFMRALIRCAMASSLLVHHEMLL